jgi:uncharacterized protein (DUF2236 family)
VTRRDAGLFPPDAVVRRVDAEAVLLLGGGRALLMQLAHPQVAAGVADHSDFAVDPFSRLRRTLDATFTIVFGTTEQAMRTAGALRAVHDRVTGPGYQANDPELLMWVHATLVDTALRVHGRFLRALPAAEAERYYDESMTIAEVLGVPRAAQPPDLTAFRAYVRDRVATLEVSDTARALAQSILYPRMPFGPALQPALLVARQLTVGLLPAPLRAGYRLSWDRPRQTALVLAGVASRQVLPRVPSALRRVPAA